MVVGKSPPESPSTPLGQLVGTRIRQLRLGKGLSVTEVAREAGVSRRMLTLIEQGDANPSVLTLDRVAAVLGTDVAQLALRSSDDSPGVFRSSEAVDLLTMASGGRAQLRARTPQRNGPELWTWVLEPGDVYDVGATTQRVDQLFLVTDGRLEIVTGNTVLALSVGDSASIRTDVGHRYVNTGADTCKFVQVSRSVER